MPPPSEFHPTQSDVEATHDAPQQPIEENANDDPTATHRGPEARNPVADDGVRVPGFEIQGELARGGMGVVYTAVDPVFGRNIAIKVLLPDLKHVPEAVARFAAEARISGKLQHPGVPPVHHLGTLPDGRPFLVMKLIRGMTLAECLKRRASPAENLFQFIQGFEQLCQAVGYAHEQGIVHRDLKPQNVMVGEFGEVQVMDWGLAREARPAERGTRSEEPNSGSATSTPHPALRAPHSTAFATTVTQPGSVLGTPAYMPPEQARGETDKVDARSDVFALGGILCAILTGQPPYAVRSSREAVRRAAAGDLTEGFALLDSSGADPELIALAKECLSRHPPNRPADGGAVARRVSDYRLGVEKRLQNAEAERTAAAVRALEQRKRKRVQFALVGAVALLVLAAGAFGWWQDRQAESAKFRQVQFDADQARVEGERKADALRQHAEDEKRHQIERDRLSRNADAIGMLLAQADAALRADQSAIAASALDQAERRFGEGGGDHLRARFDLLRIELGLLVKLDELDNLRWTTGGRRFLDEKADAQLPGLFKRLGIDPNEMLPDAAAAILKDSPIRERLLAALDRWFLTTRSLDVLRFLLAADPDPFRNAIRNALSEGVPERVQQLAARPEARIQPPRFASILGRIPDLDETLCHDILFDTYLKTPNDLSVLMSLGLHYRIGERPGAVNRIAWFRAAIAVRPNLPAAWNGLGIALLDLDDLPAAETAFREAIRINPTYSTGRSNLGTVLNRMGENDEAICVFRVGLKLDPDDPWLWYSLGVSLADCGDLRGAANAYRKSLDADPTDPSVHFNLGVVLDDLDDKDGAIVAYRRAVSFDGNYAKARYNLGMLLYDRKDYAGALEQYTEVVRIQPANPLAFHTLGDTYVQLGNLDSAIAAYRTAVRLKPGYASAHFNLGLLLKAKGRIGESNAEFREAARLDPKRFGFVLKNLPPLDLAPLPRVVDE